VDLLIAEGQQHGKKCQRQVASESAPTAAGCRKLLCELGEAGHPRTAYWPNGNPRHLVGDGRLNFARPSEMDYNRRHAAVHERVDSIQMGLWWPSEMDYNRRRAAVHEREGPAAGRRVSSSPTILPKNALFATCFAMESALHVESLRDKLASDDRVKIEKAAQQTLTWLSLNQLFTLDELEDKQKELEDIVNPIMGAEAWTWWHAGWQAGWEAAMLTPAGGSAVEMID